MTQIVVSPLGREAFDADTAARRVGVIALSTDHTTERDFARLVAPAGVAIHVNRIGYDNPSTPENLARTGPRLTAAAADLLPGSRFDAIYYACTAASAVIGDAGVERAIRAAKPETHVVNPVVSARVALAALGARRISILTPYLEATSRPLLERFESLGFTPLGLTCFGLEDDRDMARVRPEVIVAAAGRATHPDAEALFVSCTALRAAEVAARIEAAIGRPVVTSNQSAAWLCLRLCGVEADIPEGGRLFALALPEAAFPEHTPASAA